MADAKRDENSIPTALAVSDVDGVTTVPLVVNPATGAILVEM